MLKSKFRGALRKASLPLKFKLVLLFMLLLAGLAMLVYFTFAQTDIIMEATYAQQSDYYNVNSFMNTFIGTNETLERYLHNPHDAQQELESYTNSCLVMQQQLNRLQRDLTRVSVERYLLATAMQNCFIPYQQATETLIALGQTAEPDVQEMYRQFSRIQLISHYMELYTRQLLSQALSEGQAFLAESRLQTQRQHDILLLIIIVVAFFLLSMLYSLVRSVVTPVLKLSAASRAIESGNFDTPDVTVQSRDEIYELARAFNRMKRAMKNTVQTLREKNEMEQALHRHELEAMESRRLLEQAKMQQLRSQINPHFLFNTLNIISRTARLEKAQSSEKLILALARLFRYGLKTDDREVPLAREIHIVNDYLSIQTTRFESRVKLEWKLSPDIDEETTLVPAFLFQPLVENAIIHGLEPKVLGGLIRIRIHRRAEVLHIFVSDNGVGMDRETLDTLLAQQCVRGDVSGIGVGNVRSRLLLMNPNATFTIRSRQGCGTLLHMTLPQQPAPPLQP